MYDVLEVQPRRGAREIVERLPLDRAVKLLRLPPGVSPDAVEIAIETGHLRVAGMVRRGRSRWTSFHALDLAVKNLRLKSKGEKVC